MLQCTRARNLDHAPTQVYQKSTFIFVKCTHTRALLLSVLVQVGEPNKSGGLNQIQVEKAEFSALHSAVNCYF